MRVLIRLGRFVPLVVLLAVTALQPQSPVQAAAALTVEPITWNVIGLDSNDVTVGPNRFPVGARVCNSGPDDATNVMATFVWDSANAYIELRPPGSDVLSVPSLASGACTDFYFEVEVERDAAAYTTARRYHIEIEADGGIFESTPTPRELYIEKLISQSRNSVTDILVSTAGPTGPFTSVGTGGTLTLVLGETYWIKYVGSTATNGYEQIETFISLPHTIFQINSVETAYTADSSATVDNPSDKLYGDGCVWENNPLSPNYRSCENTGKAGGDITVVYGVTVISVPSFPLSNPEPLESLVYDYSGSSYHYNADYDNTTRYLHVLDTLPITKQFIPDIVEPGGTSTMVIRITNPSSGAITGVNFIDNLPTSPAAMVVATPPNASTIGCGTPTFAPAANDDTIEFSLGTIAGGTTCIISVDVTVPLAGDYVNTTGNVFINGTTPGTGTDTGNNATDTLTAAEGVGCPESVMAAWTVPTGATNPPDTTGGVASTVAGEVSVATVAHSVPADAVIDTVNGHGDTVSWEGVGYGGGGNGGRYFQFEVDTSQYTGAGISFWLAHFGAVGNGPDTLTVASSTTVNGGYTTIATVTPPENSTWTRFPATGSYSIPAGHNFVRLTPTGAQNNGNDATLNIDDMTFTGFLCYPPPTLSKAFATDPIVVNPPSSNTSLLTFTIGNNETSPPARTLTGVTFTDVLPTGLLIAAPAASTNCGSGTLTAVVDTTLISFTDDSMAPNTTCYVYVYVRGTTAGYYDNVTSFIDSTESEPNTTTSGFGHDNITVIAPPVIVKAFGAASIFTGDSTSLTFTIQNPNVTTALTGVGFDIADALFTGLVVATPNGLSGSCVDNGTITAVEGSSSINWTGGTLAAGASCSFTVNVTGTSAGLKPNSVTVTSTEAGDGNTSTDDLIVEDKNPALSLVKKVGTSASGPWFDSMIIATGGAVYYQFTVENTGDVPLTSISVTDPDVSTATCAGTWTNPLPVADIFDDDHIDTCVVGPFVAAVGSNPNTAQAEGLDGATPVESNEDTAVYQNGNFGHLPSAYENMNLYNDGGAFHLNCSKYFGATVDVDDTDGINIPTYTAKATDDGVTWTPDFNWTVAGGGSVDVTVTCPGGGCYMNAWFDWNRDYDFDDPGEHVFNNVAVSTGTATHTFPIPVSTDLENNTTVYSRFRLYDALPTSPQPGGQAFDGATPLCGEIEDPFFTFDGTTTTPVTVAYFLAEREGAVTRFKWSTATETGNIGFNLYEVTAKGARRINEHMIPTRQVDSTGTTQYSYDVAGLRGDRFMIEDIDALTKPRRHGPFSLGVAVGSLQDDSPIDWTAIRAEDARLGAERERDARAQTQERIAAVVAAKAQAATDGHGVDAAIKVPKVSVPLARLTVSADRMVRVTYEALKAAGIDLRSIDSADLALVSRDGPVPIRVVAGRKFGPGASLEFYGEATKGLYTRVNAYHLVSNSTLRRNMGVFTSPGALTGTAPASYMDTLSFDRNLRYGLESPNGDPWYDTQMFVSGAPLTWVFPVTVDNLAPGSPTLKVKTWGAVNFPGLSPDHHVKVAVNGTTISDHRFDGLAVHEPQITLPNGGLAEGANTLAVTLPRDTGFAFDLVQFDGYNLSYPRAFVARDGRLTFTASAPRFSVRGLTSATVSVYRFETGQVPVRYDNVATVAQPDGSYTAEFAGTAGMARYEVNSGVPGAPGISAVPTPEDVTPSATDYLVIAHPNFVAGIQPLVDFHRSRGLRVKVVDVFSLYEKYSGGVFDPAAIKQYVADATELGVAYVLLVGGDTYDYFNYANPGAMSFIPSLYAKTNVVVSFAPVDPMYADADNDGVPDVAIGRFPVRTTAELDTLVAKTLAYAEKTYGRTAVFAADAEDPVVDFTADSDALIAQLPGGWTVDRAHIDEIGFGAARSRLIASINQGVALTSFIGHSQPRAWTLSRSVFFNDSDAANLTNAGKPTVVAQWGCYNTYYVSPSYNSMGHAFLLRGDRGAAAVLGSSTMTDSSSEEKLGALVMPRMVTSGTTIGEAVLAGKRELALTDPDLADVLMGWTVLGDPALQVEP